MGVLGRAARSPPAVFVEPFPLVFSRLFIFFLFYFSFVARTNYRGLHKITVYSRTVVRGRGILNKAGGLCFGLGPP